MIGFLSQKSDDSETKMQKIKRSNKFLVRFAGPGATNTAEQTESLHIVPTYNPERNAISPGLLVAQLRLELSSAVFLSEI